MLRWLRRCFPATWRIFHRDHCSFHVVGSETYGCAQVLGMAIAASHPPKGVDLCVYSSNRCWKVPYSRKFGKGSRMVPWGCEVACERISAEDLVCVGGVSPESAVVVPEVRLKRVKRFSMCESAVSLIADDVLEKLRAKFGDFYKIDETNRYVRLCAESRDCSIAGRTHRHNHIYVLFDTHTKKICGGLFQLGVREAAERVVVDGGNISADPRI